MEHETELQSLVNSEPPDPKLARDLEAFQTAYRTRNFEIGLFWQRSNYFLVLNTAIAAGFFVADRSFRPLLCVLGAVVSGLWFAVNLGSKFWQERWEHRLAIAEMALFEGRGRQLFTATKDEVKKDVREALG